MGVCHYLRQLLKSWQLSAKASNSIHYNCLTTEGQYWLWASVGRVCITTFLEQNNTPVAAVQAESRLTCVGCPLKVSLQSGENQCIRVDQHGGRGPGFRSLLGVCLLRGTLLLEYLMCLRNPSGSPYVQSDSSLGSCCWISGIGLAHATDGYKMDCLDKQKWAE